MSPDAPAPVPLGARWGLLASFGFWLRVAQETFGRRRLSRVLERRLRDRAVSVTGLSAVPSAGPVVFAVNHYHAGLTLDVVAATLLSAERARAATEPRLADATCVVVGRRAPQSSPSRWRRALRRLSDHVFHAWRFNLLCIPAIPHAPAVAPGGGAPARVGTEVRLAQLRAFRRAARTRPSLVFPEGAASRVLRDIRAGAGRWLGGLGVPIVPVGVWWCEESRGYRVAIGAQMTWAERADLRDLQLGLALAALLPADLAPGWQELLGRWREAHPA